MALSEYSSANSTNRPLVSIDIEAYLPLVHKTARGILNSRPAVVPYDDMVGEGVLALAECAKRFDPSAGVPFGAFAKKRVFGCMIELYREQHNYFEVPVDTTYDDRGLEDTAIGLDGVSKRQTDCLLDQIWKQVGSFEPREQMVMRMFYEEGQTQKVIGKKLGITNSRVCQILKDNIVKIQQAMRLNEQVKPMVEEVVPESWGWWLDLPVHKKCKTKAKSKSIAGRRSAGQ